MKAYEQIIYIDEQRQLHRVAEIALEQYGLAYSILEAISMGDEGDATFAAAMPSIHGKLFHPYLGRIDGKRFMLRVLEEGKSAADAHREVALLAALLRNTDLALPEPVPACDGSLVVEVSTGGAGETRLCILLKGVEGLPYSSMESQSWLESIGKVSALVG